MKFFVWQVDYLGNNAFQLAKYATMLCNKLSDYLTFMANSEWVYNRKLELEVQTRSNARWIHGGGELSLPPALVLQISSDGDDRRILWGLKVSIPGFFWVGKFGKFFFGGLI